MPSALVSDTSILIDLERGGIIEAAFRLSVHLAVPDFLYHKELADNIGPQLLERGLLVEELDGEGTGRAQQYHVDHPALSLSDSFALALARAREWILITGDRPLTELAATERVECHGLLWLIDLMLKENVASAVVLLDALQTVAAHPRCRLPGRQVKELLARLDKAAKGE